MNDMKKYLFLILLAALLTSCGTARKADRDASREVKTESPADSLNVADSLPRHTPPVVIPHSWREEMES